MSTKISASDQVLCTYCYDPLDRLSSFGLDKHRQRFYLKNRLVSEVHADSTCSVFQHEKTLLAEHVQYGAENYSFLVATDMQGSTLCALREKAGEAFRYTPYGYHIPSSDLGGLLRFDGERADDVTGHYLLGNGYRAFNPVLMRFNSPDSLSPFGDGGLNSYAYCGGDPVNRVDPDGDVYSSVVLKAASKFLGLIGRQPRTVASAPRLTRMAPGFVKAKRASLRLIANLDESSPLKALPEERLAATPREWYLLEGSYKDLLKHHRRYVKSTKQMLSEKRKSIRHLSGERTFAQGTLQKNFHPVDAGPSTRLEALQYQIAEQRRQAGRVETESLLGFASGIRSNSSTWKGWQSST